MYPRARHRDELAVDEPSKGGAGRADPVRDPSPAFVRGRVLELDMDGGPVRTPALLALTLLPALARPEETSLHPALDLETGVVWASRNDVAVPGTTGTHFSAPVGGGDFQVSPAPYVRVRAALGYGRHTLSLTFAPLRLSGNGISGASVLFRNVSFTADPDASFNYRFDTYRLTYRYALVSDPRLELALGASALLRDSEISLSQAGVSTAQTNTGLLPLVSFRVAWRFAGAFALSLDGDGIAFSTGRFEDVALALELATGDLTFRAGYRLVEAGSDTQTIYNYAWLNHALVGVSYAF